MAQFGHSEFVGLDRLLQSLDGLSEEVILSASKQGMMRALTRMRDDARMNCPEDTGELRSKIDCTTKRIANHVRGELVSSAEHAVFVEMGTGPKGEAGVGAAQVSPQIRKNVTYSNSGWVFPTGKTNERGKPEFAYTEGMPPRPYLYPAYKRHEKKIISDVRAEIAKAIKKEGLSE